MHCRKFPIGLLPESGAGPAKGMQVRKEKEVNFDILKTSAGHTAQRRDPSLNPGLCDPALVSLRTARSPVWSYSGKIRVEGVICLASRDPGSILLPR